MRINNNMRDELLVTIMSAALKERREKVADEEHELAHKLFEFALGESGRKLMPQIPVGWLPECDAIQVRLPSCSVRIFFKEPLSMPNHIADGWVILDLKNSGELLRRVKAFVKVRDALRRSTDDIRARAKQALRNISTVKQLLVVWPELGPAVGDVVKRFARTPKRVQQGVAPFDLPPELKSLKLS